MADEAQKTSQAFKKLSTVPDGEVLGDAALATLTTSAIDTTAGSVTKTGDGGLLGQSTQEMTDLFGFLYGRLFSVAPGAANNPTGLNCVGVYLPFSTNTASARMIASLPTNENSRLYFQHRASAVEYSWKEIWHTNNFLHLQNTSAGTIVSNATVAGSGLTPAQTGTWRNVSGNDILNNGYGLWQRV